MSNSPHNIFADLPDASAAEVISQLLNSSSFRIERIVSRGQASPEGFWYDQEQHEWVLLLAGAAKIRFDDEVVEMAAGDVLHIPAHKRHRVEWTAADQTTIWLAVFYDAADKPVTT